MRSPHDVKLAPPHLFSAILCAFASLRRTTSRVLAATILLTVATSGFAQPPDDPPDDAPDAPAVAAPANPAGDGLWPERGGRMPRSPQPVGENGFYRGNAPGGRTGFYLCTGYYAILVVAFGVWVRGTGWAGIDANAFDVRPRFWQPILVLAGLAGFLMAITAITWFVGVGFLMLGGVLPFGLYVRERNAAVEERSRVFTRDHFEHCWYGFLAYLGWDPPVEDGDVPVKGAPIRLIGKSGDRRGEEDRSRQVENSRGYVVCKQLIHDAVTARGTDLHIEPKDEEFTVRVRVDGVMYPRDPLDKPLGESILNIVKVLGGMDITERRRPQDGSFRAETEGRRIDFRVATQGTRHGEKMSLRILDQSASVSTLRDLGLRTTVRESLERTIHSPHGMLLVSGPTGAGKSTTLYACLSAIDTDQRNVITVEDPVEYRIDGVNQIEINTKAGQSFAVSLRSILRQDPDVVMIGEIRDQETGEIACQAANTGHLVFSTIHANDAFTALFRLVELGVEPYVVANSVSAVLAQRLARRLSPDHREAYAPDHATLARLGVDLDADDLLYRAPQANRTSGSHDPESFRGRIGVFELLEVTGRIRDLVRDKASLTAIREEARRSGMRSMREDGLRLVTRGVTSIEELVRVAK